jgi:hypothetical protein
MLNNDNKNKEGDIDVLLLSIDRICNNNKEDIKDLLLRMKNENPTDQELKKLINELHDGMEDYVIEVINFVSKIKEYSLNYFRKSRNSITEF